TVLPRGGKKLKSSFPSSTGSVTGTSRMYSCRVPVQTSGSCGGSVDFHVNELKKSSKLSCPYCSHLGKPHEALKVFSWRGLALRPFFVRSSGVGLGIGSLANCTRRWRKFLVGSISDCVPFFWPRGAFTRALNSPTSRGTFLGSHGPQ